MEQKGWRYLAIVMDQYTRRILALSLTRRRTAAVTSAVLVAAFFHSLKAELTRGVLFLSERVLRRELTAYMRYYDTMRLHSGLAYLSPLAFERRAA